MYATSNNLSFEMTDKPDHIKALQLQIWLAKSPMERLRQLMEDNEALYKFWAAMKEVEPAGSKDVEVGCSIES